jgi:hypothetical protein
MRQVDGELWTTTYGRSAKVTTLAAASTATCLLFDDEDVSYPYEVASGQLYVDRADEKLLQRWQLAAGGIIQGSRAAVAADRLRAGKRLFVRLVIADLVKFDGD